MAACHELTDEQLVALLKQGDRDAFAEIYKRYAENLAGFAGSKLYSLEDARDLLQDLFVKLWENRANIYITSSLQSWLFASTRHRIIDKIRKNITREEYASMFQSLTAPYEQNTAEQVAVHELQQTIGKSLDQLPPRVKEIYRLSREQGLSNREIADELNLSEQTVKNQLSAALKHLRKSLSNISIFAFALWWFL